MAFEGNNLAFGNMNAELQQMIEQGGLYENIDPLEATNLPADYPLGESFFANTSPNIASWQTALNVDATFTRLFVITRVDKNRLHAFQDIIVASGTETKRFTRYNLNDVWLDARESGGGGGEWDETGVKVYSPNHAKWKMKNFNQWTNNTLPEILRFRLNGITDPNDVSCKVIARLWVNGGTNEEGGYAETWFIAEPRPWQAYPIANFDATLVMFSPTLKDYFIMSNGISYVSATGEYLYAVTKLKEPREVSVEIEVFSDNGKAEQLLTGITTYVDNTSYTSPWTGTRGKSAFEQAKNSVQNALSGTYYVDGVNGDDALAVIGTTARPFKTIMAAIRAVDRHLANNVAIKILPGTYPEGITIDGYFGRGQFTIYADTRDTVVLNSIVVQNCSCVVTVLRLNFNSLTSVGVQVINSNYVAIEHCSLSTPSKSIYSGITVTASNVVMNDGVIANRTNAIQASTFGNIRASNVTGSGNTVGLYAESGGLVIKIGYAPQATTAEATATGGQIRG